MTIQIPQPPQLSPPQPLADGLLLRQATFADVEPLAALEAETMHFPMGFHIREWMRGDHPTNAVEHFTVVEDTTSGKIVSAACLIPQTFLYEQVPFSAGRAEAVVTQPAYRRRGLVRAQFEVLHAQAQAQGQMVQVVEGATWLYRRFGYFHALENTGGMNSGGRLCHRAHVPSLPDGEKEPYLVRAAIPNDIPFMASLYQNTRHRYSLSSTEPPSHWDYVLRGGSEGYNKWFDLRIVEATATNEPVGFVMHDPWGAGHTLLFEVAPGTSWLAVTPSVLRYLFGERSRIAALNGNGGDSEPLHFCFASEHPVYDVSPFWLTESKHPFAGWSVRVPHLAPFLDHVKSALTKRLNDSFLSGHTGQLRLNFYGHGIALHLERGQVVEVAPWMPTHEREGDATFTNEAFLPLLFGLRDLAQVREDDPDCWVGSNEAQVIIGTLFPKKHSHLGPLA